MKTIQVCLSDEMIERVTKLAKESGLSNSSLCNLFISDGVRSREYTDKFMSALPDSISKAFTNEKLVKELVDACPHV